METARIPSQWEDAQNTWNSWSYAAEEMYATGVGSGETTLLVTAHTAGNTSQSIVQNFSVAGAVSSSALALAPAAAGGNLVQEEQDVSTE